MGIAVADRLPAAVRGDAVGAVALVARQRGGRFPVAGHHAGADHSGGGQCAGAAGRRRAGPAAVGGAAVRRRRLPVAGGDDADFCAHRRAGPVAGSSAAFGLHHGGAAGGDRARAAAHGRGARVVAGLLGHRAVFPAVVGQCAADDAGPALLDGVVGNEFSAGGLCGTHPASRADGAALCLPRGAAAGTGDAGDCVARSADRARTASGNAAGGGGLKAQRGRVFITPLLRSKCSLDPNPVPESIRGEGVTQG